MKTRRRLAACLIALISSGAWAYQVELPCTPETCPPVDPCKINPDRCKDPGGPIEPPPPNEPAEPAPDRPNPPPKPPDPPPPPPKSG